LIRAALVNLAPSAVVYDGLPISRGGAHGLGKISATDALSAWRRFLDTCTDASGISCWYDFPMTPDLTVDPGVVRLVEGEFPATPGGQHPVPPGRIDDALSLFEALEPLPVNRWGMAAVWLWFTADFRMRSATAELWPGQDPRRFGGFRTPAGVLLGASSSRLILQARRSIGLGLSFPEAADGDLVGIASFIEAALPIRLSTKQWTRWTLTKAGRSYRPRKVTPSSA
jgi:hypothetical protein